MPAALFKETWMYSSTNSGVWREVWYCLAGDLTEASTFTANFIGKRLKLLNSLNFLEKIQVAELNNLRNAKIVPIRQAGLQTVRAPAPVTQACVWTLRSVIIRCTRQWWLRGFSRESAFRDVNTGRDTLEPGFAADVNSFINQLKVNNYCILPQVRVGQAGVKNLVVNSIDGTQATGYSIVKTQDAHGLVAGDFCTMSRFSKKELPGLNGRFKVFFVANATEFTVNYVTPENLKITTFQGQVKKYVADVGAIISPSDCNFNFIGEHKSKNDATGSRGARSANRVRLLA
jgi:hypothetical protein